MSILFLVVFIIKILTLIKVGLIMNIQHYSVEPNPQSNHCNSFFRYAYGAPLCSVGIQVARTAHCWYQAANTLDEKIAAGFVGIVGCLTVVGGVSAMLYPGDTLNSILLGERDVQYLN